MERSLLLSRRRSIYKPSFWARLFLSKSWKLILNPSSPDRIQLQVEGDLLCAEISSVTTSKGLIWHSVEVRANNRAESLSGLSAAKAQELCDTMLQFINNSLAQRIENDKAQLIEVDSVLGALTQNARQYLSHSDVSQAVSRVAGDVAGAISHPLFDVQRIPVALTQQFPASFAMLTDLNTRHRYNETFVVEELRAYEAFFNDLGGMSLSDEQREACIRLEDNNLLVASAGSGKTATMVGKVTYVLNKALYRPEEILLLAFNTDAAAELRERIARQHGVEESALGCKISTFHALGRGVIEQVRGRPPQLANWVEHPAGEARHIDQLIRELIEQNMEFRTLWTELLVLYPKADRPVTSFDSEQDHQRYIMDRMLGDGSAIVSTMAEIYVKSLQEQTIANWLWLNSVPFEYEKQFSYRQPGGAVQFVQPDFYYPKTETVHEHFAIDKDGKSPFEHYVERAQSKRDGYRREEMDFFETTSAQAQDDTLLTKLEEQLSKRGIPLTQRPQEEIDKAVQPAVIKRYHKLVSVCIKHIRSSHLTLDMLLERAKTLEHPARAKRFAKAVWLLTEAYQQKLSEADRIDFDSMIGDAVKLIETGRYRSPYSLLLVDEFQDITEPQANLIKALKHQKLFSKVFAVGDDWQSIYRFAGSDITIFTRFQSHFGVSWQGRLEQTYRCNQLIAETAARFVQKNPEQLKKTVRSSRDSIARSIRVIPVEVEWNKPSIATACNRVLERLNAFAAKISTQWQSESTPKLKVLVLVRYNMTNPYQGTPPQFSHLEISSRTFHRSKGLEADYTLLLDVSEGNYGVPSQIEDDELLNLVIPLPETYPYAEERRLFYVAMTRASRGVFILVNQRRPSRYIEELQIIANTDVQFETVEGERLVSCPACDKGYMVKRRAKGGAEFLGCSQFPDCRHTSTLS